MPFLHHALCGDTAHIHKHVYKSLRGVLLTRQLSACKVNKTTNVLHLMSSGSSLARWVSVWARGRLVMGTRSGDLDPAVLPFIMDRLNLDAADAEAVLNRKSGLLGLTGNSDLRAVNAAAAEGGERAQLALKARPVDFLPDQIAGGLVPLRAPRKHVDTVAALLVLVKVIMLGQC